MTTQKNVSKCNESVCGTLTPKHIVEYFEDHPHDLPEMLTVGEVIERLRGWSLDYSKESRKHHTYIDIDADVDMDVDIELDDVAEFIDENLKNLNDVRDMLNSREIYGREIYAPIETETLHDELKLEICRKAMKKYTLDQIERRLDMDWL